MKKEARIINKFFRHLAQKEGLKHGEIRYNGIKYSYNCTPRKFNLKMISFLTSLIILIAIGSFFIKKIKNNNLNEGLIMNPQSHNLHQLVIRNDVEKLQNLFTTFKYQDILDEYGWSPLHFSVLMNNIPMTKLLIKQGAGKDSKSTKKWFIYPAGTTPKDIAKANKSQELLKLL